MSARFPDDLGVDRDAAALGAVARVLDGRVSEAEGNAGRERLVATLARSSPSSANRRRVWIVTPAVAAAGAVLFFLFARKPEPIDYRVEGPVIADDNWLSPASDRGALALHFSEGTEIDLGPGSKGRVAAVTPKGAQVVLGSGQLQARVVHRPHASWVVAAGPYSVEVTGTAFDVGWQEDGERFELTLHDGSVIVRGPSLHDGIRVAAGQRLVAHGHTGGAELSSSLAPAHKDEAPIAAAPAEPAFRDGDGPTNAAQKASPSWPDLVAAGKFRAVLDAAEARGIDTTLSRGTLADLVAVADAARYAGNSTLARRSLLAERKRYASTSEARAAAFVLGRLADDAGAPGEALHWYDVYLNESPSGVLASEALGRKLVVLVRQGNTDAARSVAKTYLQRFPKGGHAAYAREVLPSP